MQFEFATAGRIVFGCGKIATLGDEAAALGRRALFVAGGHPGRWAPLLQDLQSRGLEVASFSVPHEPTVELVRQARRLAQDFGADIVLGVGGGSALDTAKAVAVLLSHEGDPMDYLEVVGGGQPLSRPARPFILAPTTAGTGTEVTRNAVLRSVEHGMKVSLRSSGMLAPVAIVDPELAADLSPAVTAWSGMDAITQLIEPYVSKRAQPLTDSLALDGLRRALPALPRAVRDGDDLEARQQMALASLWSGICLANAGLGVVHGFAAVIGGMIGAPHGEICAALLPGVMEANLRALQEREPASPALGRYQHLTDLIFDEAGHRPEEAASSLRTLGQDLGIRPLRELGVHHADVPEIVANTARASSTQGNPIRLSENELGEILADELS